MDSESLHAVIYRALFRDAGCLVFVHPAGPESDGTTLDPRFDIRSHSPTGFAWGYSGSGPAQLALALLADYFRRVGVAPNVADTAATCFYQFYKDFVLALMPVREDWTKSALEVAQELCAIATARPETFAFALRRLAQYVGDQKLARYCETLEQLAQAGEDAVKAEDIPDEPSDAEIHAEARLAAAACFPTMPLAMIEGFLRERAGA